MRRSPGTLLALLGIVGLIAVLGFTSIAPAAAGSGTTAQSAKKKKKCTKKKRKKGKCGKKGPAAGDDIAQATALFAGSRFFYTACLTSNCGTTSTRTINFCSNATYNARFERNTEFTTSVDIIAGTWKFTAANIAAGTGTLSYTIDQQQSGAGTQYPPNATSQVQALSATSFIIDGTEYTRTAGGAGC